MKIIAHTKTFGTNNTFFVSQSTAHELTTDLEDERYLAVRNAEGLAGRIASSEILVFWVIPEEPRDEFVDIVFDKNNEPEPWGFIETERPDGSSRSIGEFVEKGDGYVRLRIRREDI